MMRRVIVTAKDMFDLIAVVKIVFDFCVIAEGIICVHVAGVAERRRMVHENKGVAFGGLSVYKLFEY
jgi:hypothetical protein